MKKVVVALSAVLILSGCTSGLNSIQEREYSAWERDGVLIKEKNPSTGAVLGLLPGGGSFYARETGLGICNLLFWPLSIFWDPVSGYDGAKVVNYEVTKHDLKLKEQKEMGELEDSLTMKKITTEEYVIAKRKVSEKYNYN